MQLREIGQWLELTKQLTGNQEVLNHKLATEERPKKYEEKGSGSGDASLIGRI